MKKIKTIFVTVLMAASLSVSFAQSQNVAESIEKQSGELASDVTKLPDAQLAMSVSYYPQLGTVGILGGSQSQIDMIKNFIAETDKKAPQAYLEVSIIELNEEGSKELSNTWNMYSKFFSASFSGSGLQTHPAYPIFIANDEFKVVELGSSGATEKYTLEKYSGPLSITYAINYLIRNGKGRVVVNPRIIITNGVESTIEVTQDYLQSVKVNSSTSTGGTVVTRDYNIASDQGVTINITPFISPDGYVTMNITPEYSTPVGTIEGQESVAGTIINYQAATLLSHRNLDLQNVRIKDGETLVIAGMIQEYESKTVNKIPVLGDIPLIGTVFRSTTSTKNKSEMMIMLTPKIITDNDDAVGYTDTL